MAQHDYNIANASFPTVRTDLNNVLSAINSSNSGSSRPSSAVAGTIWLDTSGAATAQLLKMYDGAGDITLGTVNFTANTVDWADSASEVSLAGTETLTNKTLTAPKINEDVAVTSTATELNLLDGATVVLPGKVGGTNFTSSLLIGHTTTGTLNAANYNTIIGDAAGDEITSGDNNTLVGYSSGSELKANSNNVGLGGFTLTNNSSGAGNTAAGYLSQKDGASGNYNSSIGYNSLEDANGNYNIGIGAQAGQNITTGAGNVIIGSVDAAAVDSARTLKIAGNDGSTTTTWISGDSNGQVKLISGYVLEVALTDAATITWNAATQPVAKVTLGASRTMGLPSNPVNGQFISLLIIQDGTGSRTITWNAAYEFAADTAPTLTATANLGDLFTFRYNGAKWLEVGRNLALTLS
jgi:hypothetical protein